MFCLTNVGQRSSDSESEEPLVDDVVLMNSPQGDDRGVVDDLVLAVLADLFHVDILVVFNRVILREQCRYVCSSCWELLLPQGQ